MAYAYPTELADEISTRWRTLLEHHHGPVPPPLPPDARLRHILDTAFFASLEREEGRNLDFVLCCTPDVTSLCNALGETVPVVPLLVTRPLTVDSIRALAPALSPTNAAILVRAPREGEDGECEIAGIVHVGGQLARARTGRSFYHRPAPAAFVVDVRGAGELHIYQGGQKLAALKGGTLHDQLGFSALEFLPIAQILARGEHTLRPAITVPANEPTREWSDFQWTALLNTILCIVNGVKEHGHGGTLLLVAPGAESSLPVKIKYGLDEQTPVLSDRFVQFLNARHELSGARRRARAGEVVAAHEFATLESAAFAAEVDLADGADLVARLSAVDGALVMGSDLRVFGFGTEIVLDAAAPIAAYEMIGNAYLPSQWPAVDSESFGMRHRSALRCVGVADETAAFVVSQDGTVSFFWKQGQHVMMKRNVNTSNPNMVGG